MLTFITTFTCNKHPFGLGSINTICAVSKRSTGLLLLWQPRILLNKMLHFQHWERQNLPETTHNLSVNSQDKKEYLYLSSQGPVMLVTVLQWCWWRRFILSSSRKLLMVPGTVKVHSHDTVGVCTVPGSLEVGGWQPWWRRSKRLVGSAHCCSTSSVTGAARDIDWQCLRQTAPLHVIDTKWKSSIQVKESMMMYQHLSHLSLFVRGWDLTSQQYRKYTAVTMDQTADNELHLVWKYNMAMNTKYSRLDTEVHSVYYMYRWPDSWLTIYTKINTVVFIS